MISLPCSELDGLLKPLPTLKMQLVKDEKECETVTDNLERVNQSLSSIRTQVEEARTSLEAHKNR